MNLQNTFDPKTTSITLERIEKLTPESTPNWGKMNIAQMFAHVNISYDIAYGKLTPKTNFFTKLLLKLFVKETVVGNKAYSKNSRTAPYFIIVDKREFETEKSALIKNIQLTEEKGVSYFEGKHSSSFGDLTSTEWSNLFYKHLDHHLTQFGV